MKKKVRSIAILLVALLFAITFLFAAGAVGKKAIPEDMPVYTVDDNAGNALNAVSIEDVSGVHTVTAVNYYADKFTVPPNGKAEHIGDQENIASRGTFQLVFLNLDPMDEKFLEKAESLNPYLSDGYSWHFTLYLPPIFSACNIYLRSKLVAQIGKIENYDFIEYSDKKGYTETHKNTTEPIFLDITLYSRHNTLSPDPYDNASIVTIHYEADEEKLVGFDGRILFGEDTAVRAAVNQSSSFLYAAAVCAVVIFALFAFVCILFRSVEFSPQLLLVAGIAGIMVCGYLFTETLGVP